MICYVGFKKNKSRKFSQLKEIISQKVKVLVNEPANNKVPSVGYRMRNDFQYTKQLTRIFVKFTKILV